MLNQTIQSFTIGKELGSGGMATVYLAENRIGKKVAIKVLAKEHFHNEQIRLRFEQEARVMASLNHENICSVIDLEENDEFSAIIMEYLEGVDLGQYVNQHDPVPKSQVMDWLRQIASGLDYAHSQGYVHRDIKPSNFFLTEKGQIKIMDFGIAKAEDSLVKSQTSSKMGSVAYMSPEQIISTKHVDHKTDIYSLGVTLHHLLGGRVPYDSTTQSRHDIEQSIISEPLPVLPVSGSMQAILEKATEKDREARPDTVAALLGATGDDTLLERKPAGTSDKTLIEPADDNTLLEKKEATTKAGTGPKPPQKPKPESPPAKATASKAPVKPVLIVALILLLVLGGVRGYAAYTRAQEEKARQEEQARKAEEARKAEQARIKALAGEFVKVRAGTFMMGCTSEQSDCDSDEKPAHRVTLTQDYYLGKYEVTQAQWRKVMGSNPSWFENCDNCPVENVSWNDIQKFLRKLNAATGKNFRLPTEAEWEYVARGGQNATATKYAGINSIGSVAWYDDNSGDKAHPVGQKAPNEPGLYDMSGNVWEWCSDWYDDYSSGAKTDPKGPSSGQYRVLRGGSGDDFAWDCRVSNRDYYPGNWGSLNGFRLCLSL